MGLQLLSLLYRKNKQITVKESEVSELVRYIFNYQFYLPVAISLGKFLYLKHINHIYYEEMG